MPLSSYILFKERLESIRAGVRWSRGCCHSGSNSNSGSKTKRRIDSRGCGSVRLGVLQTILSTHIRSISMIRSAYWPDGVRWDVSEICLSICCRRCNSASGGSCVVIFTPMLRNRFADSNPHGSDSMVFDTIGVSVDSKAISAIARAKFSARLPIFEPIFIWAIAMCRSDYAFTAWREIRARVPLQPVRSLR